MQTTSSKPEPASPLLPVKEGPASPRHNRGIQIGRRVKDEPSSPQHHCGIQIGRWVKKESASPPRRRYGRMDAP